MSAGSPRPDPEGHHDDLPAADLDGLTFAVPDDARELSADRERWLAETRRAEPQPRQAETGLPRTGLPRRWRLSFTAALLIGALLVVGLSSNLGGLVTPSPTPSQAVEPLASVAPDAGQVGSLLPTGTLTEDGEPMASRALRPAVIALLPDGCDNCASLVEELRRQAAEFSFPVTLVGGPDQSEQLADLRRELGSYRVNVLTDPEDVFAASYGRTAPTVLLVRNDGLVVDIVRDPPSTLRLEAVLATLSGELDP